jgi:hypothetical protein
MCLDEVFSSRPKAAGYGWKVYELSGRALTGIYMEYSAAEGEWLKAPDTNDPDVGFHIYKSKRCAEKFLKYSRIHARGDRFAIVRVRYRKAHAHGRGDGGFSNAVVVVAKEMFIYPRKKAGQ